MLFCHKIHYIWVINTLLSQNLVVEIYAFVMVSFALLIICLLIVWKIGGGLLQLPASCLTLPAKPNLVWAAVSLIRRYEEMQPSPTTVVLLYSFSISPKLKPEHPKDFKV